MRQLLGDLMFDELEIAHPFLLKIGWSCFANF